MNKLSEAQLDEVIQSVYTAATLGKDMTAVKIILDHVNRRMPEPLKNPIKTETAKDIGDSMGIVVKSVANDEISEERGEKLIGMMKTRLDVYSSEVLEALLVKKEDNIKVTADEST